MKAKLCLFIFLFTNILIFSQPLSVGIKGDINIQSTNLDLEFGSRIVFDYQFETLPFSVSGNLGFSYAELGAENNLSASYTKTKSSLGLVFNYYPIKWAIEPYVGVGLFYNINDLSQSGNAYSFPGNILTAHHIENNFAYSINGGIKFSANSSIHFITEIIYSINKPGFTMKETAPFYVSYTEYKDKFDFNALYLSLGLMFDL